jgi:hypothetical protein
VKYLSSYRLFEAKEHYHWYVVIEWEHGGADGYDVKRYPFKSEDEMDDFLNFIYDMRKFIPNSGYGNSGHFSDGHHERLREWINEVDKKYGNRFSQLVPSDRKYRVGGDYAPKIEHIWVEQDGVPLHIVWQKALKSKIINIPKIGETIKTNIGHISYYGPTLWGEKSKLDYMGYKDFEYWDEDHQCKNCNGKGWVKDYDKPNSIGDYHEERCPVCKGEHKYTDIEPIVTDCKINPHLTYKRETWDREGQRILSSYTTYNDIDSLNYVLLCEFAGAYITCDLPGDNDGRLIGFDPNFENKFHYPKYGTNDFYLVQ